MYTEEELELISEMDRKYPYFNVNLDSFKVHVDAPLSATITVDDKIYALELLALLRLSVNKDEFANVVRSRSFKSSVTDSYPGSAFNINFGDTYNNERLIIVLKNASYNTTYIKNYHTTQIAYADVGNSLYVRYGYQSDIKFGKQILLPNINWQTEFASGIGFYFAALLFHEHMHNLGFDHKGSFNTPLDFQNMLPREVFREMTLKYPIEYEKLKKYYLLRYRKFLTSDTI